MPHESETTFEDHVEERLRDEYGAENVVRQFHFESDDRIADFVVTTTHFTLCFELENDSGSVVNGSGQARYYAQHFGNGVPVLAVPTDHIDMPERELIEQSGIVVLEFDDPTA